MIKKNQPSFFDNHKGKMIVAPLPERMRPTNFDEFVGQEFLVSNGKILRRLIEEDRLTSMIFWGPPGVGKTTLAQLIAGYTNSNFIFLSAVTTGVKELREIIKTAEEQRRGYNKKTILFVDEVHRFNESQQDFFLPYVEKGNIIFIGATTENPSFEVNAPLLSRSRVFVLKALSNEDIKKITLRALNNKEKGLGKLGLKIQEKALDYLVLMSNGDARVALTTLEMVSNLSLSQEITFDCVKEAVQKKLLLYDQAGEEHYNIISALHKSLRGGDVDASLYWLARMLEAGEDPLFVARRLVRFASEDVGMADPQALVFCIAVQQAVHFIGMPEGNTALAQAVVYLATAPKSNALYKAYQSVVFDCEKTRSEPVPLHLRNAVSSLTKNLDYGKEYLYPHDYEGKVVVQKYFPDSMSEKVYYFPGEDGLEKELKKKIEEWRNKRFSMRHKAK